MEAQNILNGNINDLKELHVILDNYANISNGVTAADVEKQKIEKEAAAEEKLMLDNIEFTIKKRRDQVVGNFDNEIIKVQDKLKKVRNERGKEKNKKVAARIKEETKDLVLENKNIKEEYRTYMKQNGLSKFWDNKLFISLFYPRTPIEMLILMVTLVFAFIGVPVLLCSALSKVFVLIRILVVMIYIVLILLIFAFLYRFARDDYKQAFLEIRKKQALIYKNNSQINKIKKKIKKDKNEDGYELHDYDNEIKELEDSMADIVVRKNVALDDFEKTTREEIYNEIYRRDIISINEKKQKINDLTSSLKDLETQQKEMALNISTNYTAYMGAENMTMETIERLIMIMDEGKATTVGDAINVSKAMV